MAVLLALLAALLSACSPRATPRASAGTLDLRSWDFARGAVSLSGQWRFDWQHFVSPSASPDQKGQHGFMSLPAIWNNHVVGGKELGSHGFGSFRLTVLLPRGQAAMALRFRSMGTAYSIYANGKKVGAAGIVGTTQQASQPEWRPKIVMLGNVGPKLDLLLHVSNFHHRNGGPPEAIELGRAPSGERARERSIAWQMLLAGAILAIGLYHLGLTVIQRRELAALFFALFCFAIGLYTLLVGERYFATLFPTSLRSWQSRYF